MLPRALSLLALLLLLAFGSVAHAREIPTDTDTRTVQIAPSGRVQGGTLRITVTRLAADKLRVRANIDVTLTQGGEVGLGAQGCVRGVGAICSTVRRQRVYKLAAGRQRLTWQTTLKAGPRLYSTTVTVGTGDRMTPEGFGSVTLG